METISNLRKTKVQFQVLFKNFLRRPLGLLVPCPILNKEICEGWFTNNFLQLYESTRLPLQYVNETSTICKIHLLRGNHFVMHPTRTMFWQEESTLVVSDVHIGKAGHFRKAGLAIPKQINQDNFWKLASAIAHFTPKRVLFLGDLSHSRHNKEWEEFGDFLNNYPDLEKLLVLGNHDVLAAKHYEQFGIQTCDEWNLNGFRFLHEPLEEPVDDDYTFAGHIHPGVRMYGSGKQSLRLSCFYFGEFQGLMPAFGAFTGKHIIKPSKKDAVFVVLEDKIVAI